MYVPALSGGDAFAHIAGWLCPPAKVQVSAVKWNVLLLRFTLRTFSQPQASIPATQRWRWPALKWTWVGSTVSQSMRFYFYFAIKKWPFICSHNKYENTLVYVVHCVQCVLQGEILTRDVSDRSQRMRFQTPMNGLMTVYIGNQPIAEISAVITPSWYFSFSNVFLDKGFQVA